MKLSSIEGSSRNVFQDQKNEFSDDSHVRQSSFIADIALDSSKPSNQEHGRLIMLHSDENRDTSPTVHEMSTICNSWQNGAAAASTSISSQFNQQNKGVLTTLSVDQAQTSTTTSLVASEVSAKFIGNDSDQNRQLDSSADSVSLEQLDQDRLKTQEEERANMGNTKLPEVKSVSEKVVGCNEEQNWQTDSSSCQLQRTIASSQAKRCSNTAWIYDKRGSTSSNNKSRKDKSTLHSFCHADRAKSCVDAESDENQEERYIAWLDYSAAVEWKFELTADQRFLKSLVSQEERRCTRAYAKIFGSTPKRIRAFYVEKIVAKKDDDMKPKVDANSDGNKDNHLKEDDMLEKGQAQLKFVKPIEEQQIQSQLKDDQLVHATLSETNLASTINKEKSCKQTGSNTVSGSAISCPVFIQFGSQPEVRCDQPITFLLILQGQDLLVVTVKEGAKENGSDIVSSATTTNPVLKKFNYQFEVRHERVTTSSLNFQCRHLSIVTKEVKNKGAVPDVKVQDVEKQKVSSAFSSPTSNG
ncbi:OLC1v1024155C1 [Oldenlandia corymbosa var. corymbosa]|uniref:OLC1v1024155C1 n=1 Tax=Oldenlandia corymbosa var. corymbosa TaxID=529605 RepID=A0AAV1C1K1_OLDCO|nr:OLC1v1024155C1 [Oldenlandia corymbosa var. corymbosa]